MMKRQMLLGLVVLGLLVSPGLAAIIHDGQADPTTEGWALIHSGYGPVIGAGNDGKDYWKVDLYGSYTTYRVNNTTALNDILDNAGGWKMTATVEVTRSASVKDAPFFGVRDGSNWWQLSMISTGIPATTGVYIEGAGGTATFVQAVDISAYHMYDMTYNPTADAVSVSVDGGSATVFTRSQVRVEGTTLPQINFGALSPSTSFWNHVELSAVPEPATMALLAIGGCGVLLRRRRA